MEKNMVTGTNGANALPLHIPDDENASAHFEVEGAERERPVPEGSEREHAVRWRDIYRIALVAAAAGALWFLRTRSPALYTGIGVLCALVGGYPIFREATENILERRTTMELSMAIAILAALGICEVLTALVITLFVLAAEVLESLTVRRRRQPIRQLIDLLPGRATVRRKGVWTEIESQEVLRGEVRQARGTDSCRRLG
jgi:cation transport ATPase